MRTEHQNKTAQSLSNASHLNYETNGSNKSFSNPDEGSLEGESFVDRVGLTTIE